MATRTQKSQPARTKLPSSWKKAAGLLRGKKSAPQAELRRMRKEWEKRLQKLDK